MREVKVNRKAANRVSSGHPWIFQSDIVHSGEAQAGDVVRVSDHTGRPLGTAHFSSSSQITLRMLSSRPEPVDAAFFRSRIAAAIEYRKKVVRESDAYRVVFGEADFLPGLVVDRYGDHLVTQFLSQGMQRQCDLILDLLSELLAPKAIVARNDAAVRTREGLDLEIKVLRGELPGEVPINLNGLRLSADLIGGQKTGIFLDQRENYRAAANWSRGKALDCFTSTGGFALHMARNCEHIEAIDSSAHAVTTAANNAAVNGISNIHFREGNVFDMLSSFDSAGRAFDTIVLDPPAFAKSRANIESAMRGYKEINLRALRLLAADGVLITCSCSHHVSEALLLQSIAEASLDAKRRIRVLERRTQALDHPILLTVPETHYLKCLILQVV